MCAEVAKNLLASLFLALAAAKGKLFRDRSRVNFSLFTFHSENNSSLTTILYPMLKRLILLLTLVCSANTFFAQSKTFDISGTLYDTLDLPLASATVLLLNPGDSTMLAFVRSNEKGEFTFSKVQAKPYLLKASYIGCIPTVVKIAPQEGKLDLGIVHLSPIDAQLFEVVIKTAKAPMIIRGDTIEYDASTFKVPPGSTVEDLLRRLPGVEVDTDGKIKAQGKDVNKVTVDGKQFFGGDPTMATKNLPAEGISKVQVYSSETEESKVTGVASANADKTINLELKDEFKKGAFGKVVAGYGTQDRAELKGNYNRFNEKLQFSFIGVGNNTGRNGLGWNDYQDFRGSQAFNWGDNNEFGFGGGGGYVIFGEGDDESDEPSTLNNSFFSGNPNGGFPLNGNAGLNLNYDYKKTKLSGVVFSDYSGLKASANGTQQNFLPENTYYTGSQNSDNNSTYNHKVGVTWSQDIDSLNAISLSFNGSLQKLHNIAEGRTIYLREDSTQSNQSLINNDIKSQIWSWKANATYRKKFKLKGRAFAVNATHFENSKDNNLTQSSNNSFYNAQAVIDSVYNLNQAITGYSNRQLSTANAMYVEPLGKRFFWQSFYNFNYRTSDGVRNVNDVVGTTQTFNDSLSRVYNNQLMTNRAGTMLRYSHKGLNITLGGAFQRLLVKGKYNTGVSTSVAGEVNRYFDNWIPNFNINADLKGNRYVEGGYSMTVKEPSVKNLQPIVDNSNPLYIRVGNPNLVPEVSHSFNAMYYVSNTAKFTNYYINLSFDYKTNPFTTKQTVDSLFVTTSQTINYANGYEADFYTGYNFPLLKNMLKFRLNYGHTLSTSYAFINEVKNRTFTQSYNPRFHLSILPNDNMIINLDYTATIADTRYDINSSQNQVVINQNLNADINTKLFWKLYLNTNFNYARYQNARFGLSQNIPIWNLSISRTFLKNDRGEIRLSIYDVFNRNLSVEQYANANIVSQTRTNKLARYAMLSFTYNIRGITKDVHEEEW